MARLPRLLILKEIECWADEQAVRVASFEKAKSLSGAKGILNVGAGHLQHPLAKQICHDESVIWNVDLVDGQTPNFVAIDLEKAELPFANDEFGCVFASHVLEHLQNWQAALDEWCRVADAVVIAVPPVSLMGYLHPQHKQHFSRADIAMIESRWPKVYMFQTKEDVLRHQMHYDAPTAVANFVSGLCKDKRIVCRGIAYVLPMNPLLGPPLPTICNVKWS